MSRIALAVEYDGSNYHGWQRQPTVDSIQARLEHALSRVADASIETVCAGRTDRGVHATYQVVHFESPVARPERAWLLGGTFFLPADITLLWAKAVPDDFHARFSATARSYRYVILNRETRPALHRGRVTWHRGSLDADAMHVAGQHLLGEHDFSSFRARDCQSISPVRHLESLTVRRQGDYVYLDITANAFLHHMVRNIVGTLLPVGEGRVPPDTLQAVLAARQRTAAGITAPADGLYLVNVRYPGHFGLEAPPGPPVFWAETGEFPPTSC
ncbi:tRNA pseudouridine(38,39,40) synthase TruA [Halothiobacillus diazotrophicus]|uniref:tRNA pseudouridine synthase A n=1 Tax=Halothiobacillus diazotrophicus TaxID=1860122 RepID=A0A191ZF36_9GAMM|nr:tRNA pseudouridine(38-40) synthase TruA [Halothiobacillus diazotrophicus]ANJ66491.1 tRNA pseudouridine(38,39,40) synthase TruA [Halothiobacillus diazotrophicus]